MQKTQEPWVQSLGWEDPLEEDMATHSSILAWRIPRTEEPGGLLSMGSQRVRKKQLCALQTWRKIPLRPWLAVVLWILRFYTPPGSQDSKGRPQKCKSCPQNWLLLRANPQEREENHDKNSAKSSILIKAHHKHYQPILHHPHCLPKGLEEALVVKVKQALIQQDP